MEYDRLYAKFKGRYPGIDFDGLMYNQKITVRIDFYLSLVIDGMPQGRVVELADGSRKLEGVLYTDLNGILSAKNWSNATKQSLPSYFGIRLEIFQPSRYSIEYLYQSEESSESYRQEFTYGIKEKLAPCSFFEAYKAHLMPGLPEKEDEILLEQESHFLGWSYEEDGKIIFSDGEEICNLTDQNGKVIRLYAVFERKSPMIPDIEDPAFEILGWSREKREVYEASVFPKDMEKLFLAGDTLTLSQDLTLYAVLQEKRKRVRYRLPDQNKRPVRTFIYEGKDIRLIQSKIRLLGFPSKILTRQLAYGIDLGRGTGS